MQPVQSQQQPQFQAPPNDQPVQYGPPVVVVQPNQQQPQQPVPYQYQYQYQQPGQYQVPPPPPQPNQQPPQQQQQQQQYYPPGPSAPVQSEESKAEKTGRMIGKGINSAFNGVVNTGKKLFK